MWCTKSLHSDLPKPNPGHLYEFKSLYILEHQIIFIHSSVKEDKQGSDGWAMRGNTWATYVFWQTMKNICGIWNLNGHIISKNPNFGCALKYMEVGLVPLIGLICIDWHWLKHRPWSCPLCGQPCRATWIHNTHVCSTSLKLWSTSSWSLRQAYFKISLMDEW